MCGGAAGAGAGAGGDCMQEWAEEEKVETGHQSFESGSRVTLGFLGGSRRGTGYGKQREQLSRL